MPRPCYPAKRFGRRQAAECIGLSKAKTTFEDALLRLERIVEAIESGQVGLEDSVRQFEEGMKLIQHCRGILTDAELKIQKLQTGPRGELQAAAIELTVAEEPPAAIGPAADDVPY